MVLTTATAPEVRVRVRLSGGPGPREGRLYVYYNGTWGTVCDDFFNDTDTRVVCYMLGYGHSGRSIGNRYGAGSGQIWLDNVQCRGTERSIVECRHNGWGFHNCVHDDDVSVSCPLVTVRLVGSKSPREGRLEVNYRDTWGTVCDGYFSDTDAGVVCYMLGYGRTGRYIGNRFGAGSGQIWLDDVWCRGTEINIADCGNRGWGRHDCTHHQDVSVSCPTVTVRLAGGGTPQEGRLEVIYNRTLGTVCRGGFSDAATSVVCYMLRYGRSGWVIGNRYGAGNGLMWLDNVRCNGTEISIAGCRHSGWGRHNCGHDEAVSVSCIGDSRTSRHNVVVFNNTERQYGFQQQQQFSNGHRSSRCPWTDHLRHHHWAFLVHVFSPETTAGTYRSAHDSDACDRFHQRPQRQCI